MRGYGDKNYIYIYLKKNWIFGYLTLICISGIQISVSSFVFKTAYLGKNLDILGSFDFIELKNVEIY